MKLDYSVFFDNKDEDNCPVTCDLKTGPKCNKDYDETNLLLTAQDGLKIIASS